MAMLLREMLIWFFLPSSLLLQDSWIILSFQKDSFLGRKAILALGDTASHQSLDWSAIGCGVSWTASDPTSLYQTLGPGTEMAVFVLVLEVLVEAEAPEK